MGQVTEMVDPHTSTGQFKLEVCMGVGFPWEWESDGILMGMGIAI